MAEDLDFAASARRALDLSSGAPPPTPDAQAPGLAVLPMPAAPTSGGLDFAASAARAARVAQADSEAPQLQAQFLRFRQENSPLGPEETSDVFRTYAALRQRGEQPTLDFVRDNLPELKRRVEADDAAWPRLVSQHPELVDYFSEEPARVDLVADDLKNVDGIAWALKALPEHVARHQVLEQEYFGRTFAESKGLGSESNRQAIQDLEKQMAGGTGAEHWYSKIYAGTLNMFPMLARYGAAGWAGAQGGAIAAAPAALAAAPETGGVGSAVVEAGGAALGAKIATGTLSYYETVGPAYWRLVKSGVSPTTAHTLAEVEAGVTGAIFAGAGTSLLSRLGVGANAAGDVAAQATEKALADKTLTKVLADATLAYGKNVAHAAAMMGAIGGVQQTSQELAGWIDQGKEVSLERIGGAVADSVVTAARDMLLIAAYAPVREALGNLGGAMQVAKDHEQLQQAVEGAEQSKLLERAPDEFRQFVATLGQRGLKTLYSPIDDFNAYWEKRRADPRTVAARLAGDDGTAYDHAVNTGGDLPIPVDNYLTVLGKTEHARELSLDIKIHADGRTPRQEQARVERRAEEIAKIPYAEARLEEGRALVERWWRESLERSLAGNKRIADPKAVAEKTAKLQAEAFDRVAQEINRNANEGTEPISAWDVFRQRARVELVGQKGVRAGDIASEAYAEPAALSTLEQYHAGLTEADKLGAYYRDRNTGLLNERGAELAPHDPERPMTAVFSFEGKKPANDLFGHKTVDGALRAMGRVLDEGGIRDGVQRKGNVQADVRDQAHADELAASMAKVLGVRVRATAVERGASTEETATALGAAHDAREKDLVAKGEFADRGQLPADLVGRPAGFRERSAAWASEPEGMARADLLPEHSQHYIDVGPEQSGYETYREQHGLLNELGFHRAVELTKPEHVVSADMRGIGKLNEVFGRAKTNVILDVLLDTFARHGGGEFNLSHLHGDELGAASDDAERLHDFFQKVREETDRYIFYGTGENGGYWLQRGVHFAYGVGSDFDHADREALPAAKAKQNVPAPEQFATREELTARLAGLGSPGRDYDPVWLDGVSGQGLRAGEASAGGGEVLPAGAEGQRVPGDRNSEGGRADVAGAGARAADSGAPGSPRPRRPDDEGLLGSVLPGAREEVGRGARAFARRSSVLNAQAWSKWDAFQHIFDTVGGADSIESEQADSRYRRWLNSGRKGEKPGPFPGGDFDTVNRELGREPGQGVSGALEAFDALTKGLRWSKMDHALELLRTVPGLEKLRLPNEVAERLAETEHRDATANLFGADRSKLKQPDDAKGPRGSITFEMPRSDGKPRRYNIDLDGADESTAAHETLHMMTEVLHDVATGAGAPPTVKADYEALIRWMGHASPEERVAATRERISLEREAAKGKLSDTQEARRLELEAREERAAVGWEEYLREGKAPSARLADVFSRFAGWLSKVYRAGAPAEQFQKAYGQDLGLTPEVRGLFDRLLASEDQLAATANALEMQPLPLAHRAMTEDERAQYADYTQHLQNEARNSLLRALGQDRAERSKVIDEERTRLEADRNRELDRQPGYRLLSFLQDREVIRLDSRGEPMRVEVPEFLKGEDGKTYRLDRKDVDRVYGKGAWKTLPAGTTVEKGGIAPGELAEFFGFDGAEGLVRALQVIEPRNRVVQRDVQDRLREIFGPALLDNPSALFEEAVASEHTDAAANRINLEIRAMRRQLDREIDPRAEVVKEKTRKATAKRLMDEQPVGEISPGYYRRAEQEAAKRALRAALAGDAERATGERETQLLNQYLYRYAREAKERADHVREMLDRKTSDTYRAALGKAVHEETLRDGTVVRHREYLDAHDALLSAVGIGRRAPDGFKLDDLLARMNLDAADVGFDVDVVRDILDKPRPYDELTSPEVTELDAAVKNVRAAANAVLEVLVDGKRVSVKGLVDGIKDQLEQLPFLGKEPAAKQQVSVARRTQLLAQGADGGLIDPAEMFDSMGQKAKEFFFDRYIEARTRRDKLEDAVLRKVFDAFHEIPEELRKRRHEVLPGLREELPIKDDLNMSDEGGPRDRQWLWMVFLNLGNEGPKSNSERLLKPFGWTREQALNAVGKYLTPAECEFLQKVLSLCDRDLWPEISAKEERKTGLAPEKIKASPIEVKFADGSAQSYDGGYFPARYRRDAAVGDIAQRQAESAIQSFYGPTYERASTPKSHTKARAAGYANVLDLDWSVVTNHLAQVVHDIAFDEFVRDSARVLMHPDLQNAIYQRFGAKRSVQPREWLKAVANAFADSVPESMRWWQNLVNPLRNRAIWSAIGGSIPVAMGDIPNAGLATVYGDINPLYGAPAIAQGFAEAPLMLTGKSPMRKRALELSVELQHRARHNERMIKAEVEAIGKKQTDAGRAIDRARMMMFGMQEATDALASTQIFMGAFNEGKAKGLEDAEASRLADDIVRRYQPSHDVGEQSAFLRDKRGLGAMLIFQTWWNKRYNMNRRQARIGAAAAREGDWGRVALSAGRILAASVVFGAAAEYLSGKGKRDDETWGQWVLRKTAADELAQFPFGGMATPLVDYAVTGTYRPGETSVRTAPGVSVVEDAIKTIGELASGSGSREKRAWDAIELLLLAAGGPSRQVRRTGQYIQDLVEGDAHRRDPAGVVSGLMYGERDHQSATPFVPAR